MRGVDFQDRKGGDFPVI